MDYLLYVEYRVDPLALILPCYIIVHCHGHVCCSGYNCSNTIVSEEFPTVTRTRVGGDLGVRNLLPGTEWVGLALAI